MSATTPKPVSWKRYAGDTDTITVKLNGVATMAPGAVVTATLQHSITKVAVSITGSVANALAFTVTLPLTTWLASRTPGRYDLLIHVDDVTWPEEGLAWIDVVALPTTTP